MTYDTLIQKFCPLIRDQCKGESCTAYSGNATAGQCHLFSQEVGADTVADAPAPPAQ